MTFTGFLSGEPLLAAFSTFDVGVIPDPKNVYNDKISMNKVFEYMSLGIPFVQFDLDEGRKAAGGAALYAKHNCPRDLAANIGRLIEDPALRDVLADTGLARARAQLNWDAERTPPAGCLRLRTRRRAYGRRLAAPGVIGGVIGPAHMAKPPSTISVWPVM